MLKSLVALLLGPAARLGNLQPEPLPALRLRRRASAARPSPAPQGQKNINNVSRFPRVAA